MECLRSIMFHIFINRQRNIERSLFVCNVYAMTEATKRPTFSGTVLGTKSFFNFIQSGQPIWIEKASSFKLTLCRKKFLISGNHPKAFNGCCFVHFFCQKIVVLEKLGKLKKKNYLFERIVITGKLEIRESGLLANFLELVARRVAQTQQNQSSCPAFCGTAIVGGRVE